MEKLILGMLILRKLTVYEIRVLIRDNFSAMCSDSMGSIQAALKRLITSKMIVVSEYVEKGVNKKRYSITEKGRAELMAWIETPANISGVKNMEFGKLLFMGMLTAEKRKTMITEIIEKLESDLAYLLEIQAGMSQEKKSKMAKYWKTDEGYFSDVIEKLEQIAKFEELTFQHSIDTIKFNIEWFKNLLLMERLNRF